MLGKGERGKGERERPRVERGDVHDYQGLEQRHQHRIRVPETPYPNLHKQNRRNRHQYIHQRCLRRTEDKRHPGIAVLDRPYPQLRPRIDPHGKEMGAGFEVGREG